MQNAPIIPCINPFTPSFAIESKMRELIRFGDETLVNKPKNLETKTFVLSALAYSLFLEIQNYQYQIESMRDSNQNLLITLTYKVGFIGKKLSKILPKNKKIEQLKSDYETLYKTMAKLRIVKSGILDLSPPVPKSKHCIDADFISQLRAIYQTHELDVFAKEFPDTKQVQENYNNFIKKLAEEIDYHRPKPRSISNDTNIFDLFIKEEQERLFPLITYFPIGREVYKSDFEKIAKCTQITSIQASLIQVFDSLPNPILLRELKIYRDYEDRLSSLVNLESLGIWGKGSLNALPHPEKLKSLEIIDFTNFPEPSFWAKCTSLEEIVLKENDERRAFDLSYLPHPEKIKTLIINNTVFPDLTPFHQLEVLKIKDIQNLEQSNTISNCNNLSKLKVSLMGMGHTKLFFEQIPSNKNLERFTLQYNPYNYPPVDTDIFTVSGNIADDLVNKNPSLKKIKHTLDTIIIDNEAKEIFLAKNVKIETTQKSW